jgi:ABC-type transport system involved in cytochrome c biogenesis permease subunit
MIDHTTSDMTRLPELSPPTALAANVMARIARLPGTPLRPSPASGTAHTRATRVRSGRFAWAWALSGVAIVSGVYVSSGAAAAAYFDLTASRFGRVQPVTMPVGGSAMLLLALGLTMYVVGLFAPVRRR